MAEPDLMELAVLPAAWERVIRLIEADGGLMVVRYPGELGDSTEDGVHFHRYFVAPRDM
jgi:hypothetical protein